MAWIILAWLWGGHSRVFGAPCEGRQTIALHNYTILHVIVWFTDAVLEQPFFDDLETTGPKYNRLYAYLILLIKGSFFAVTNGRFLAMLVSVKASVGESPGRGCLPVMSWLSHDGDGDIRRPCQVGACGSPVMYPYVTHDMYPKIR